MQWFDEGCKLDPPFLRLHCERANRSYCSLKVSWRAIVSCSESAPISSVFVVVTVAGGICIRTWGPSGVICTTAVAAGHSFCCQRCASCYGNGNYGRKRLSYLGHIYASLLNFVFHAFLNKTLSPLWYTWDCLWRFSFWLPLFINTCLCYLINY